MDIEITTNDSHEQHPEGWITTVTAWAPASKARKDQTIDGTSWETDGRQGYAVLVLSGAGRWTFEAEEAALDALIARLERNGYNVDLLP